MATAYGVAIQKAQKRLGKVETILLEEIEGDSIIGRTSREAPEIDALIRLPQNGNRPGEFISAKLSHFDSFEYTAKVVIPAKEAVS